MQNTFIIFKRELTSYFITPVAYVFIVIFLFLAGVFTFNVGQFFERGQADLRAFFDLLPWLLLFLIPAVSMRLWSEERRNGTIELLMTLPVTVFEAVLGKFLAAWAFTAIALLLTFPLWITVNYLGEPDNGVIFASYLGGLLMAGSFLAIGSFISALTKNQVIAFVLSLVACLMFVLAGFPAVQELLVGWVPLWISDTISRFGFLTIFQSISRGLLDLRHIVLFVSLILSFLIANAIIVEMKKAE